MKHLLLAVLSTFVFQEPPDVVLEVKPPECVVRVNVGTAGGSGTVIASEDGKSLVLTNQHVAAHAGNVSVNHKGKDFNATLLSTNAGDDLALLLVDVELPAAVMADAEPDVGTEVEQWGYDWRGQGKWIHKTGKYKGVTNFTSEAIETSIESISGDSGCGIFNKAGQLVAVNWGRHEWGGQLGTRLKKVVAFLKAAPTRAFNRLNTRLNKVVTKVKEAVTGPPDVKVDYKVELMLFTTDNCPYCDAMKAKLKKLGIPFHTNNDTPLKLYPVLGVYKDKKLQESLEGDQTEQTLRALWDRVK